MSARRVVASIGLAGGAAVVAMITASVAHADDINLLLDAQAAETFMSAEISTNISNDVLPASYETLLQDQVPISANAIDALTATEAIQAPAIAHGTFTGPGEYLYGLADNYFINAANTLGEAVGGLQGDPSPSLTDLSNILVGDYEVISATNDLNFLDQIAPYLGIETTTTGAATELAHSLSAESVAGLGTAVDPGVFADLLSSIAL